MVKERHYPHNHDDLVTVGGREVIFDSRGFEYVDGEVVVASEDLEAALRVLEKRYDGRVRDGEATSDVAVIEITVNADPLDIVARLTAAGIPASPNHVLQTTWHSTVIGTGQPKPARPSAWLSNQLKKKPSARRRPIVAVIDTGIVKHSRLNNVRGLGQATDRLTNPAAKSFGHGTFVAGLIAAECPDADIRVVRAGFGSVDDNWFGLVTDADLAASIDLALARLRTIDVLNLSIGGYTHDNRPLFATSRSVARAVRRNVTVVAGAGNDGRRDPFYPAAEPGVIGVGSIDADGKRSCFSNIGPWIDLEAVGEDVVSTFPETEIHCMALPAGGSPGCRQRPASPEQDVDFTGGFARWSGTSFSAARVSGAIAATRIGR
jgi:hypothetical protein